MKWQSVGERCELMHEVFLLDIDIDLADVTDVDEVVQQIEMLATAGSLATTIAQ